MSIPIASVLFAVVGAGVGSFAIPKFNVCFVFIRFWDGVSLWDWQGVVLSGKGAASGRHQVWALTQFYSVDFSKSRIVGKKVCFQQTHNKGLRQLFLTVSWDHGA